MADSDLDIIAPLIVLYYNWLSGHGGTDPETLLASPMTESAKRLLRERMDDVNFVYALTSPLRQCRRADRASRSLEDAVKLN